MERQYLRRNSYQCNTFDCQNSIFSPLGETLTVETRFDNNDEPEYAPELCKCCGQAMKNIERKIFQLDKPAHPDYYFPDPTRPLSPFEQKFVKHT